MKTDNELIAEFMGFEPYKSELGNTFQHRDLMGIFGGAGIKFKYNSSWDWLMPVVEKIDALNVTNVDLSEWYYNRDNILDLQINSKIKDVYEAVVEFIKWHNSNGN